LNFSKQFKERLENVTAYYTNEEMDIYINNNFFLRYFPISFIHSANQQFPKINLEIFKIESLFKKFKIRNSQLTKRIIESGKNDKLKKKYANYIEIKKKYEENSKLKRHSNVLKSLENKIEAFERELATKTFNNKRLILFNENLFQEIKEKLNEDDVIVDLLNYYYFDNESGEKSRGVMDALIIKKEYEFPKFIKLFDNSNFDSLYSKSKGDINRISKLYNDVKMSDLFLSPLTNEFEKEKYIYISLSGISSKINFNALLINDFQTLGEKYQVHLIGSSYDFLTSQESYFNEFESIDLLLYGDIDYDNIELNEVATFRGSSNNKLYPMRAQSNVLKWSYLPGSDKEVNEIKVSSDSYGFKSQIIKGNKATKSSILLLDGKKDNYILHLATHGFFFEGFKKEPTISNGLTDIDPMLRAGLVFAGVNKYWGEPIDSSVLDDGILTAKEISNLDLNSCQLVVLSACETGLGEINGSEGVYGLQRAFKMAGVKNVIMSLWKVPDAQTAELFGLFYEGCFKGLSIHESLRVAQSKMKEKYSPYYWAGFILLE
jgi:CHAT domain-containing protein